MKSGSWKWLTLVSLSLAAWLVPLSFVLTRQRVAGKTRLPLGPSSLPAHATHALILYVDAWPTRITLNLEEIQGATAESPSTLAPAAVAQDLGADLAKLGVTAEVHRIDALSVDVDLARFRPIILIYSSRHGLPASGATSFLDRKIEPLVARQRGPGNLFLTDVVLGEEPADSKCAQTAFTDMARYYGVGYRPGPRLDQASTWLTQAKLVAAQAAAIRREIEQ